MATLNPMAQVRRSCGIVAEQMTHVEINEDSIAVVAEEMSRGASFREVIDGVKWDASGWHYCTDTETSGPLTCQYIFVLDALNFCFWPSDGLEYDTLAISLKTVRQPKKTTQPLILFTCTYNMLDTRK